MVIDVQTVTLEEALRIEATSVVDAEVLADGATLLKANNGTVFASSAKIPDMSDLSNPSISVTIGSFDTPTRTVVVPEFSATNPSGRSPVLSLLTTGITNTPNDAAWSPDGVYLAVTFIDSPYVMVFKRSELGLTKLPNFATPPAPSSAFIDGTGVAWSADGQYLAITMLDSATTNTSEMFVWYKRSGDTFTKLVTPAPVPTGDCYEVSWSPNGQYVSCVTTASPYVITYKRSGDTLTRLGNVSPLPPGQSQDLAWSPNSQYLAVAHTTSPFFSVYKVDVGDTLVRIAPPADLVASNATSVSWSPNGRYLAVTFSASPYVAIYKRFGDVFSRVFSADPTAVPAASVPVRGRWSPDGKYFMTVFSITPFVGVYKFQKEQTQLVLSTKVLPGVGKDITWSPDGTFATTTYVTAPYFSHYSGDDGASAGMVEKLTIDP